MWDLPSARAATARALIVADLEPGGLIAPSTGPEAVRTLKAAVTESSLTREGLGLRLPTEAGIRRVASPCQ